MFDTRKTIPLLHTVGKWGIDMRLGFRCSNGGSTSLMRGDLGPLSIRCHVQPVCK